MELLTINKALAYVQANLKAQKNQFNKFGNYKYRSCEDILEAVKPLLTKVDASLTLSDDIVLFGDRFYVKAVATFSVGGDRITTTALAREPQTKKGMDESQITGATSSYARKYALNGLFAIDDAKDSDSNEKSQIMEAIAQAKTIDELTNIYNKNKSLQQDADILGALTKKKGEMKK